MSVDLIAGNSFVAVNPFVVSNFPDNFKQKHQADYRAWMLSTQQEEGQRIRQAPKNKPELVDLFYRVIDRLSQSRREIAERHQTPFAERFGARRDLMLEVFETALTYFAGKYNKVILKRIADELKPLNINEKSQDIKKSNKTSDIYHKLSSSFEVEVLEEHHLKALEQSNPVRRGQNPESYNPVNIIMTSGGNYSRVIKEERNFKNREPVFYKNIQLDLALFKLEENYPKGVEIGNLKEMIAVSTMRLQFGKQMFATSKWITWLSRQVFNHPIDPISFMLGNSIVQILHMDKHLIDSSLKKIADLFAEAVLAANEDREAMQKNVGLMRYYLAHAMPWARGSAAIGEALEGAVYNACGFNVLHNPDMSVDLEALSIPEISAFMKKYPLMVQIIPSLVAEVPEEKS